MIAQFAACLFAALVALGVAFHLALIGGLPWGELTMGGRYPGRLPLHMRAVSLVSACLLIAFAVIVATAAGLLFPDVRTAASRAIWFVVGYCALGVLANSATRSKRERAIWLPVVSLMLAASLNVAMAR
jgi:hypothetical protein